MQPSCNTAFFPFVIVANRVVQHKRHVLNGATLEVGIEICDISKDAQKTIQVTGLAAKTTKDSILNYFENNRRSGGGEVESVDLQNDKGVAFLTFVDASGECFEMAVDKKVRTNHFSAAILLAQWVW